MLYYVQSIVVKWLADVTHQQFQDTWHLRRKPSKGILAYLFIYLFSFWKPAPWMSPARGTHLEETYFRHWATVHVFRFRGRVLSVWRHKGCSSKSLHQAALEETEKDSADGYRAVERFQPTVGQVAQDVQAVLGKQAHKLRLVVDQGVGHGILQVLVLLSSIKRSCMVGDEKNTCAFTTSNVFFPAYPPLDVSIEELTLGDVDPVPCDGQFQLFIVRAGVHRRAVFTGYTHQGTPKSTRAVLRPCQLCEKWDHLPPTRALSRTVSKSFGPSCSPW